MKDVRDDDDVEGIALAKRAMRRAVRARLATRTAADLDDAGTAVAGHLAALLPASGTVALFASRAGEVSTFPLDALLRTRGLRRAVPRMVRDDDGSDALAFVMVDDDVALADLPRDRHGIPTPVGGATVVLSSCALVVVPGLAFDATGGRLGYGRGYYDRALGESDASLEEKGGSAALSPRRSPEGRAGRPPRQNGTCVKDDVIVGVLDDCQWVERVPCAPWDRLLPRLVSPGRGLVHAVPRG